MKISDINMIALSEDSCNEETEPFPKNEHLFDCFSVMTLAHKDGFFYN